MQTKPMPVFSYYQTLLHINPSEYYSNRTQAQRAQACEHHGGVDYLNLHKKPAALTSLSVKGEPENASKRTMPCIKSKSILCLASCDHQVCCLKSDRLSMVIFSNL